MPDPVTAIDVDLFGQKVSLPEPVAKLVIEARDKDKTERRQIAERLGSLEATARAAEEAQRKAVESAELAKLTSKGDYETALRKAEDGWKSKHHALTARLRDAALSDAIAKVPGVLPAAARDIAAQLASGCTYDADTHQITFVDAAGRPHLGTDGKPATADAVVAAFLTDRPWYRAPTGSPGSGAGGAPPAPSGARRITSAEYQAAMRDPIRAPNVAKELAARTLIVAD
jgi:hypothetical protein